MSKNIDKRVWGVLGKQQTYYSPQKQVEGKTKTPLNGNAFDSWDAKRSRFKRVDGYENAVQQGGAVPQVSSTPIVSTPTPTPTITLTPSITPTTTITPTITSTITPSITPTITSTNTPTPSITPTNTITPSITPTNTLTPTPSCAGYAITFTASGSTPANVCCDPQSIPTLYSPQPYFTEGQQLYYDACLTQYIDYTTYPMFLSTGGTQLYAYVFANSGLGLYGFPCSSIPCSSLWNFNTTEWNNDTDNWENA